MIETLITRVEYDGDDVTLAFAVTFPFFADGDLEVYLRDEVTGALDEQLLDTEYVVTGGEGATGTVTMVVAPTAAQQLVIERVTAPTQESDYQNQAEIPHETLEHDFDRAVTRHQEVLREMARSVRFPPGDPLSLIATLPAAEDRAEGVLAFDVDGNVVVGALSLLSPGSVIVGVPGQILLPLSTFDAWRLQLEVVRNVDRMKNLQANTGIGTRPAPATFESGLFLEDGTLRLYYDALATTWFEVGVGQYTKATLPVADSINASRLLLDTDNLELLRQDAVLGNVPLRPPLPRGSLGGMNLTRTATAVTISAGECRAGTSADRSIRNARNTAAFTKALNATWAAGTGNGGRAAGVALLADTWYHVFALVKTTGAIDAILDTSVECVNGLADAAVVAAGFGAGTTYRRLGSVRTDGASNIKDFVQHGDIFEWLTLPALDVSLPGSDQTGSDKQHTLTFVPPNVRVEAIFNINMENSVGSATVRPGDGALGGDPLIDGSPLNNLRAIDACARFTVLTDTAQRIKFRVSSVDPAVDLRIQVEGYIDARGRWD